MTNVFGGQKYHSPYSVNNLVLIAAVCFLTQTISAQGAEPVALLTLGAGPQVGADQTNRTAGVDLELWQFDRSPRQKLSIGVSYTYLHSTHGPNERLHALSVYPQLTLTPGASGWARSLFGHWGEPYFFVRALGPSYISNDTLGEREQANHFAFQAQLGVGINFVGRQGKDQGRRRHLSISWKHFSNANLFSDNDGIDIPLVVSIGTQF